MLSEVFSTIRVEEIYVKRNERIRKTVSEDAVEELAASILRCGGLIHPIVIDRENTLVAGETRLRAVKKLGWERITFQYLDSLDEKEQLLIELEENVKRKDLDWKDKCDALLKFHNLQKENDPDWTVTQTAEAMGYSISSISSMLGVAEEVNKGNRLVLNAPKLSTAKAIVARAKERQQHDMVNSIVQTAGPATSNTILQADFKVWAEAYAGPRFNLVHCDFPYGINFQDTGQGAVKEFGAYKDKPRIYWELLETMLDNIDSIFAESAHLIFWFAMNNYQETVDLLSEHFVVDPFPLIWHKNDGTGMLPDFNRGPRRVYETALFCARGDRKIVTAVANLFAAPPIKTIHANEKNESMLRHFFRMCVDENTRMLDPTCGSGTAVRAAKGMGAREVLGLEIDPEFANAARAAMK